jgi:hypothetical protein
MDTGKVVDVEVLSKFCKLCKIHDDDDDTPKNKAWKIDHKSKGKLILKDRHQRRNQKGLVGSLNALWTRITCATLTFLGMEIERAMVSSKMFTTVMLLV